MRGWFDAFRDDGGPTLYTFPNRTPVTGDVSIVAVSVLFATLYIAFLVIFPGVRKQKFSTYITVTLSLFVGLVILVTRLGSSWHVSQTTVVTPYKAFSREKLPARIGAHIGLMHINITLCALPIGNWTPPDIDYNERFSWNEAEDMGNSYRQAIRRGLPYPILTVAEYFSLGQEGFAWGGRYRAAGYYASILLWASFAAWILMNLLLVSVPRYGAYTMCLNGVLLISAAVGYYLMLPVHPLTVIMEGGRLEFHLGWCYWLVLVVGVVCLVVGAIISTIDLVWPHTFSTILEVYYDTPYDRHVILEESHDVRYRKRNNSKGLEDPPKSLGGRILRRLSSKANANSQSTPLARRAQQGHDNLGYSNREQAPKSPWRYPFRRSHLLSERPGIQRTLSQDSTTSSISVVPNSTLNSSATSPPPASMHKIALSRMLPKTPVERTKELDNW